MQGMADAPSDSSSADPLLDHKLIDAIDGTDVDMLLSDAAAQKTTHSKPTENADTDSKRKRDRKEKKKKRRDRKRKRKERHKKKKKKKKGNADDEDFLLSDEAEDADVETDTSNSWDRKAYDRRLKSWSVSQLESEQTALLRQIEHEKTKAAEKSKKEKSKKSRHRTKKSVSPSSSESDNEDLNSLSIEGIISKIEDRVHTIKKGGQSQSHTVSQSAQQKQQYEEDPSKLYCVCRQPYDNVGHMICCDYCQEWYHLACIGLSADKVSHLEHMRFKCPICNGGNVRDVRRGGATLSQSTFDSPKNSPNPRDPEKRKPSNSRRRFIADTDSDDIQSAKESERAALQARKESVVDRQRCAKYSKVVLELQTRLKESKATSKRQQKEMAVRLSKAKGDIDEERQRRQAVEAHMSVAKRKSEAMVAELGDRIKAQQQKEAELVAKLKKLESNKKKYKESASENKRKMRSLKEEHEMRVAELEDSIIPTLSEQLSEEKTNVHELQQKMHTIQQQARATNQQATHTISQYNGEFGKLQAELSRKNADSAKLHNLVSQLRHKMDALHSQAQQNHLQWEAIDKSRQDKIARLEQQINGPSVSGSLSATPRPPSPIKIPQTPAYLVFNELELSELKMCRELCRKLLDANLFQVEHMAQRASLTREVFVCWVTGQNGPSPTVINDLKLTPQGQRQALQLDMSRHLSMNAIRLLLIEIRKQLEVIGNEGQSGTNSHDAETLKKVSGLLRDFQSASTAYEARMNEFKQMQHVMLLDGCRQKGASLEMLCVVGSGDNGEPKSEWVKVTVHSFDQSANRVLVNKGPRGEMSYAAIDAATLRLPMASTGDLQGGNGQGHGQGMMDTAPHTPVAAKVVNVQGQGHQLPVIPVPVHNNSAQPQPHWNMSLSRNGNGNGNVSNNVNGPSLGVMNLNGMPSISSVGVGGCVPTIPGFHNNGGAGPVLPPFNDLQANMCNSQNQSQQHGQHHISNTINTINTNNNIRINGVTGVTGAQIVNPSSSTTRTTIVIDGDAGNANANGNGGENSSVKSKSKSKSRKRKRGGDDKGKKGKKKRAKSRSIKDDSSSDSESSEDSDNDSDLSSSSFGSDTRSASASSRLSKNSKKDKGKKKKSKSRRRKEAKRERKEKSKAKKERKKSKRTSKKKSKKEKEGTPSSKKKGGSKKRVLEKEKGGMGESVVQPAKKRQKMSGAEMYEVVGHAQTAQGPPKGRDANDSVCRICKHPGDLVCCEGCPSVYHADCIRPRIRKKWLDAFEGWYCPSCAPRFAHMPLRNKATKAKWPVNQEPLLCDLKGFLKKHSELERDPEPEFHPSRKAGNKH